MFLNELHFSPRNMQLETGFLYELRFCQEIVLHFYQ